MRHALLLGNLLQLSIMTLLVIYAAREQGRRALIMLGLAVVLTAVMTLAGCAHSVKPHPAHPEIDRCQHSGPPAYVVTVEQRKQWIRWMTCTGVGANYGAPQPLYEEAGPGEESDE